MTWRRFRSNTNFVSRPRGLCTVRCTAHGGGLVKILRAGEGPQGVLIELCYCHGAAQWSPVSRCRIEIGPSPTITTAIAQHARIRRLTSPIFNSTLQTFGWINATLRLREGFERGCYARVGRHVARESGGTVATHCATEANPT